MNRAAALIPLLLIVAPATAWAQDPDQLDPGVYDRCLAQAAVRMSYTDARNEDIFGLAKRRCAATRASIARQPQMLAALDAADATKAANFPKWMSRLRERRQLRAIGLPLTADIGYR